MLTVRLQGIHLRRSFVVWSTEERKPQKLSLASSATFYKADTPGIISIGVLDQNGLAQGTGLIEFCDCVSGENRVVARTRQSKLICSLVIFVERQGFVATEKYDLETLKDQCAILADRYASVTPPVLSAFGFRIPAATFTRYWRQPTAGETDLRDGLLRICAARYGTKSQMTPSMFAEAMGTVMHFCYPQGQTIAEEDMVEAVYSSMFVFASFFHGTGCHLTMVHLEKKDGSPHVALALFDSLSSKNYLVDTAWTAPTLLTGSVSPPDGLKAFTCPSQVYKKVVFQHGEIGMRYLNLDVGAWLNGKGTQYRKISDMDSMVLDKVFRLYAEVGQISGKVVTLTQNGGSGNTVLRRFARRAYGAILSGCKTIHATLELDGTEHTWTEYIVFE